MDISRDTFEKADVDTKLLYLFDVMKKDENLDDRVVVVETSLKWSQRFQLFILGAIGKLMMK